MSAANLRHKDPGTKRADRPWTSIELAELRRLAPLGAESVADVLERPVWSVKKQAQRQRISLRRDGERRGIILGQPRGVPLATVGRRLAALQSLREDVLAGRVDVARMERRVRLINSGVPLCPSCGRRPQEVEATGLCEDCHLEGLAWAHGMEADRLEAQRTLDRERQRKHRRRVASGIDEPVDGASLLAALAGSPGEEAS